MEDAISEELKSNKYILMQFHINILSLILILFLMLICNSVSKPMPGKLTEPQNASMLNSEENDFAPSWNKYRGELFFSSGRRGKSLIFTSTLIGESGNNESGFTQPALVKGSLNDPKSNRSYITFASRKLAYLTSIRQTSDYPVANIYYSIFRKQVWNSPLEFEPLLSDDFSAQPAISPDGFIMIFSSDRQAEEGDTDLWMIEKQEDGSWNNLRALDNINSPGNEITPFLASGDTLYFASDGQGGPGGFDLYISVMSDGEWQRPEPMYQINTEHNESDLTVLPGGLFLFASDRPGGKGKLDLYFTGYDLEAAIDKVLPELEISLNMPIKSVKAKNLYSYQLLPVSPYIFYSQGFASPFGIDGLSFGRFVPSELFNIDSVYQYSPVIISQRLKEFPGSELLIYSWKSPNTEISKEQNSHAKDVFEFFTGLQGIDENRIAIGIQDYSGPSGSHEYFVHLTSFNPEIFAPIEIRQDSIILSPRNAEINCDIRPSGILKSWELFLQFGNGENVLIAEGRQIQKSINIDLAQYASEIAYSDSLIFSFYCNDKYGRSKIKRMMIPVTHSGIKSKSSIEISGKRYEEYFAFITSPLHIETGRPYDSFFQFLRSGMAAGNNIIIQYFDKYSINNAEAFADKISNAIDMSKDDISIIYQKYSAGLPFNKKFKSIILRILKEKPH